MNNQSMNGAYSEDCNRPNVCNISLISSRLSFFCVKLCLS